MTDRSTDPAPPTDRGDARVLDLRERRRRDTCQDISAVALDLFERHGVAATTVGDIAREAGISQSTFFRHFPTKEESVLVPDLEVERTLAQWLERTPADRIGFGELAAVYGASLSRLARADDATLDRVLRTRRLILGDAHLRSAAFALDAVAVARVTDAIADALGDREPRYVARLMAESATTAVRVAFDTWAESRERGDTDADLTEIHRTVCADLRRAVRR